MNSNRLHRGATGGICVGRLQITVQTIDVDKSGSGIDRSSSDEYRIAVDFLDSVSADATNQRFSFCFVDVRLAYRRECDGASKGSRR